MEQLLSKEQLLEHWQGHRRLTRRVIETFPEDQLFSYQAPEMRSFGALMLEVIGMVAPTLRGVQTGVWESYGDEKQKEPSKAKLFGLWDEASQVLAEGWGKIPDHRFQEVDTAFGMWEMPGINMLFYLIDNEIHHRAQGYVYLRELGIEPPAFYER